MLNIKEFQKAMARLDELKDENSKDKASLEKCDAELMEFKDRPHLYAAVKLEIDELRAKILRGYAEREPLQKYVREHQSSVGQEILDYLKLLRDEADSYLNGSDRSFIWLKTVISEISHCTAEIETLLPLIEHLHSGGTQTSTTVVVEPNESSSSLGGEQILLPAHEFSQYVLHNKQGYSLKSFFKNEAAHIQKVLDYYSHDYQATLFYLQTKHGLCSGQTILLKTFEALCAETFGFKKSLFSLCLDGNAIPGENNSVIFINCLSTIGLSRIVGKCSFLFNSSLDISVNPILSPGYGVSRQIEENGVTFNVRCHSSDSVKLKQLEHIQKILDLNLTITLR